MTYYVALFLSRIMSYCNHTVLDVLGVLYSTSVIYYRYCGAIVPVGVAVLGYWQKVFVLLLSQFLTYDTLVFKDGPVYVMFSVFPLL